MIDTPVPGFTLRFATPTDVPVLLRFIRELSEYERLAHEVVATEADLLKSLFGPRQVAEAVLGDFEGEPVAFALFFHNFSTFLGRPGLYLEDLYVTPSMRGRGCGRVMLQFLAKLAVERGCGRFEWWVLDWNEPAIALYKRLRAVPMEEWTVFRLTGDALSDLAAGFDA